MAASPPERSSTGIENNLAGLFCYALWLVTGVLFLILEKKSTFVRFHAVQSILTGLVLAGITLVGSFIPFLGALINLVMVPVTLVLWILLMVKAFQGERFKLPWVGEVAERNSGLPG